MAYQRPTVKAAVVRSLGSTPEYGEFAEPTPGAGETIVSVTAAAVTPLVRLRAAGTHYTADQTPPFVPGVDGVGRTPDGRRVYFQFVRPPFGSIAERAPVVATRLLPVPDGLDDATAAAAAISGMAAWVPLTVRAPILPGESVLVNGATGVAGRVAIQVAKHLGASRVIATGRTASKLRDLPALGADVVLPLGGSADELREAVRKEAQQSRIGVVLDYLWGPSAEILIDALGGPNAPRGPSRIRFVQVGQTAAPTITLAASKLRSSGVELVGTGIGGVPDEAILRGISEFFQAAVAAKFRFGLTVRPASDVARAWSEPETENRLVLTFG